MRMMSLSVRCSADHVANVTRQLERLEKDCELRWLVDITRDKLSSWMSDRLDEGKMSNRTVNTHRSAILAFCGWCVDKKRGC